METMGKRYFNVLFHDDSQDLGVARSSDPELFFLPEGEVVAWQPETLRLTDGDFGDYLANDLGVRLCSEKMRDIIDKNAGPRDDLRWLPVFVEDDSGVSRPYWVLHFPKPADVIDREKSVMVDDFVAKLALHGQKLVGHSVFSYREGGSLLLIVSEDVKARLVQSGCTGIQYSEVRAG
jgi:hypothetical protein